MRQIMPGATGISTKQHDKDKREWNFSGDGFKEATRSKLTKDWTEAASRLTRDQTCYLSSFQQQKLIFYYQISSQNLDSFA